MTGRRGHTFSQPAGPSGLKGLCDAVFTFPAEMSLRGTWRMTGTGPERWITHTPHRRSSGPDQFASLSPWGRTFDLFGFYRWSWHVNGYFAWDCFGFSIFHYKKLCTTAVLVQFTPGAVPPSANPLMPAQAAEAYNTCDPWVIVWTGPNTRRLCGFGVELVASVRGIKHWVRRWRRGVQAIREQHVTMVMTHNMPGLPEVEHLLHSFL